MSLSRHLLSHACINPLCSHVRCAFEWFFICALFSQALDYVQEYLPHSRNVPDTCLHIRYVIESCTHIRHVPICLCNILEMCQETYIQEMCQDTCIMHTY